MTPLENILGAGLVAVFSGTFGAWIGSKGKIADKTCHERQSACVGIINVKLEALDEKVGRTEGKVDRILDKIDGVTKKNGT